MSCGRPRAVEANGLPLMTWEWGVPGQPPALLLHSLAAHSHHLILDDPAGFADIVTRWVAGAQKEVSP